jgi:hypothetical protein
MYLHGWAGSRRRVEGARVHVTAGADDGHEAPAGDQMTRRSGCACGAGAPRRHGHSLSRVRGARCRCLRNPDGDCREGGGGECESERGAGDAPGGPHDAPSGGPRPWGVHVSGGGLRRSSGEPHGVPSWGTFDRGWELEAFGGPRVHCGQRAARMTYPAATRKTQADLRTSGPRRSQAGERLAAFDPGTDVSRSRACEAGAQAGRAGVRGSRHVPLDTVARVHAGCGSARARSALTG